MSEAIKGKFIIQHFRDGELLEEIELEQKISTIGVNMIVDYVVPNGGVINLLPGDHMNMKVDQNSEHLEVDFSRASGLMECETCGKLYYDHLMGGPMSFDGEPFLHVLCDGRYVKL